MAKASIFGRHTDWIVTAAVAAVLVVVIEYGLGGLDESARTALLIFALAVVGWAGPFDNTFVALTAAVVMALAVAGSPDDLFRALGDNIIWLLVAAFIFAAAFRKSGLADLMAQKAAARARSVRAMFYSLAGVMVGSAFVIPSTSGRAAIMLPIFGAVTEGVHPRIRVAFALLMPTRHPALCLRFADRRRRTHRNARTADADNRRIPILRLLGASVPALRRPEYGSSRSN